MMIDGNWIDYFETRAKRSSHKGVDSLVDRSGMYFVMNHCQFLRTDGVRGTAYKLHGSHRFPVGRS